jgi:conjugative relaxase-like TrwC/TraI family protein
MVRHKQFCAGKGQASAGKYFTQHLAVSDYYAKGMGRLMGRTLEHLDLKSRDVTAEVFRALEENRHPETDEALTLRTNTTRQQEKWNNQTKQIELETVANRRTGMDLPFIAPKTVSMVMAENPGELADAMEKVLLRAADKGMELAEALAKTRVRVNGAQHDRVTGNLLYFRVIHRDARPENGVPDPFWHAHHFCFNATYDADEKRLKAVELHDVLRHADAVDAVFLSEAERGLNRLGIGTQRTPDGRSFEITSVTPEGKDLFSKRHARIMKEMFQEKDNIDRGVQAILRDAHRLGKTLDPEKVRAEQENLFGKRLAKKKLNLSPEETLEGLRVQMTPEIRASLQREAVMAAPRVDWLSVEDAQREVAHAVFKKRSVAHELDVANALLRRVGGELGLEEALEFARGPDFVRLSEDGHVTTEAVQREEWRMRTLARDGWDHYKPLVADPARPIQDPRVAASPDQAAAARFLWSSRDLVMDVSGIAGAGKSTMLKEVVPAIRETGRQVILLAPTSASVENLKKDFPQADTLQHFQSNAMIQEAARGSVIVLDESSLVSVPQLAWLVDYAARNDCRLITAGDSDQHHAVERGDAIRILQDSMSVRSVELTETYRAQVAYLKASVVDLKARRREEGYDRLDAHGDIREVTDLDELRRQAIETHLEAVRSGHLAILASPIHTEARQATAIVRAALKAGGLIEQEEHAVTRIARLDLEGVELKDPLHYQPGRVVGFYRKAAGGFLPGEKWRVVERGPGREIKLERGGVTKAFNPEVRGKWDVYEPSEIALSVGDRVRITQGFREGATAFKNNDLAKVAAITPEHITLNDGRKMTRQYAHLDQGVTITSHASECRTVRQMTALVPMSSFAQVNAKAFYVLVSRATHRSVFFTDCKEAFREATMREGDRQSVYEYEVGKEERTATDQSPDLQPGVDHAWPPAPESIGPKLRRFEESLWRKVAEKYPDPDPEEMRRLKQEVGKRVSGHKVKLSRSAKAQTRGEEMAPEFYPPNEPARSYDSPGYER